MHAAESGSPGLERGKRRPAAGGLRPPALLLWPLACGLWLAALTGCARFPAEGGFEGRDLLIVEFRTAEPINRNFYYYIALDTDGTAADGPLPVAGGPFFGNGWGTGSFTHFVEYHAGIVELLRGGPDNDPPPLSLGPPFRWDPPSPEDPNRLRVEIDLFTLAGADQIIPAQVELNIIAVNVLVLPGDTVPPDRDFDALGPTGNTFLIIGTDVERVRSNRTDLIEGRADTSVPAIDIVDWTIEISKGT